MQDILDARLDVGGAGEALDEAQADLLRRPWPLVLGAYALAGASLSPVIGGGSLEAAAAGIVGAVVGSVVMAGQLLRRMAARPLRWPPASAASDAAGLIL